MELRLVEQDVEQIHHLVKEIGGKLLFIGEAGSRVSSTHTANSDHDYLCIVVAKSVDLLGLNPWKDKVITNIIKTDGVFQELSHFIQLISEGNVHVIESVLGHSESVHFKDFIFSNFWTQKRLSKLLTTTLFDRYLRKSITLFSDREKESSDSLVSVSYKRKRFCFTLRVILTSLFLKFKGILKVYFDDGLIASFLVEIKTPSDDVFREKEYLLVNKTLLQLLQNDECVVAENKHLSEQSKRFLSNVVSKLSRVGDKSLQEVHLPRSFSFKFISELENWVADVRKSFDSRLELFYKRNTEQRVIFKTCEITVVESGVSILLNPFLLNNSTETSLSDFIYRLLDSDLTALTTLLIPEHESLVFDEDWKQFRAFALAIVLNCNFFADVAINKRSPLIRCFLAQQCDDRGFSSPLNEVFSIWTSSYQTMKGHTIDDARLLFNNWIINYRKLV